MIATLARLALLGGSLVVTLVIIYWFKYIQESALPSPILLLLIGSISVYGYGAITFMTQKGINPLEKSEGYKINE